MDSSGHKSATSATQRPYRTSFVARAARATSYRDSTDRVRHSVDRPRGFLHVLSSCTQIRQYRIPDGSEFMKFSVRIPMLNFRKYSAQVQVIPENSESEGILVLHSDSQTYATDEYYIHES